MRQACQVGHKAMEAVLAAATAGRSEAEAVAAGTAVVVQAGGVPYNAFAETYGPGRAARGRGRLPTYAVSPPLEAGEIFTIDMSGALNGYLFDFSRSRSVGPETPAQRRVHSLARDAVLTVVAGLSPGATVATAVQRGLRYLADAGYVEGHAHFTAFGHGLGLGWENPWLLPDNHTLLEPGMCVAVEKVVAEGTLGASYEEDVLITENGPLVLTADGEGRS
jgi:Xaa-Pro aminopeptidase